MDDDFKSLVSECMSAAGHSNFAFDRPDSEDDFSSTPLHDLFYQLGWDTPSRPQSRNLSESESRSLWAPEDGCADKAYDQTFGRIEASVPAARAEAYEAALDEAAAVAARSSSVVAAEQEFHDCFGTSTVAGGFGSAEEAVYGRLLAVLGVEAGVPLDVLVMDSRLGPPADSVVSELSRYADEVVALERDCAADWDAEFDLAIERYMSKVAERFPDVITVLSSPRGQG